MMHEKTNTLVVRTPEGVSFSFLLAGPITRFLAWLVDIFCISLISQLIGFLVQMGAALSFDFAVAIQVVLYFVVSIGYGILLEWQWRGQTLGKRLLRIRVMDESGLRLQFSQVAIRNLLRFIDLFPLCYFVGGIACLVSKRAQRLGDFAASTIVVRTPNIIQPDIEKLAADKYNSFRDYPHLEARLRQRVSPQEAGIALEALFRRDELYPEARVELFAEIADHFRSLVAFPDEIIHGLADEQYVRNVVETLFRQSRPEKTQSRAVANVG